MVFLANSLLHVSYYSRPINFFVCPYSHRYCNPNLSIRVDNEIGFHIGIYHELFKKAPIQIWSTFIGWNPNVAKIR